MAALATSLVSAGDLRRPPLAGTSLQGYPLKMSELSLVNFCPMKLSGSPIGQRKSLKAKHKSRVVVRAAFRDAERPSNTGILVGGFLLGGLIIGALGCIYAPQISKALAGADRKDLRRKLPKFIYDEEKALEKTRKILEQKIEQLNSAIDDVSSQLRTDDAPPNGAAIASDEVEAAI